MESSAIMFLHNLGEVLEISINRFEEYNIERPQNSPGDFSPRENELCGLIAIPAAATKAKPAGCFHKKIRTKGENSLFLYL